jgi:hypothetical protein
VRRLPGCHRAASRCGPPALLSLAQQIFAAHLRHHELDVIHTLYYGRRPEVLGLDEAVAG